MQKMFSMNPSCSACGQSFNIETGFYWGAMYIAYMLTAGYMLSTFGLFFFVFGLPWEVAFTISAVTVFMFYPLWFRLSRAIWINFNVHYDAKAPRKAQS
jgi:hypothetical protein